MFATPWAEQRYPSVVPAGFLVINAPFRVASGTSPVMSRVWFDEWSC
jgi:hypothetical protein